MEPVSSKDLLLSILSMDAYHRGYNAGVELPDLPGSMVGVAEVVRTSGQIVDSIDRAKEVGFYGVYYKISGSERVSELNEKNVVSLRGTDDPLGLKETGNDFWKGWLIGAGFTDAPWDGGSQAGLAIEFYENVTGNSVYDAVGTKPILTGHSLGAGLSGFLSLITGSDAVLFDHMPFAEAALGTLAEEAEERAVQAGITIIHEEPSNDELIELGMNPIDFAKIKGVYLDNEILESVRDGSIAADLGNGALITYLVNGFLGAAGLYLLGHHISDHQIAGEADVEKAMLSSFSGVAPDEYVTRSFKQHSMSYLIQVQFATKSELVEWQSLGREFFLSYFNEDVARAAGAEEVEGGTDLSGKMGAALAYSAIEEGTTIFGNTGIRAMFDDLDELGALKSTGGLPAALEGAMQGLTDAIVQFGGQMAVQKVVLEDHSNIDPGEGILVLTDSLGAVVVDPALASVFSLNMNKELWNLTDDASLDIEDRGVAIYGIGTILDSFFGRGSAVDSGRNEFLEALSRIFERPIASHQYLQAEIVDRVDFVLANDPLDLVIEPRSTDLADYDPDHAALFASGDGDDQIRGSYDNNIIMGGDGADMLWGGLGRDALVGGAGHDKIIDLVAETHADGSEGAVANNDVYFGGSRDENPEEWDIVEYSVLTDPDDQSSLLPNGIEVDSIAYEWLFDVDAVRVRLTEKNGARQSNDILAEIDQIVLSDRRDLFANVDAWRSAAPAREAPKILLDGSGADQTSVADAQLADWLDFSTAASAVFIGDSDGSIGNGDGPEYTGVELYAEYDPVSIIGKIVFLRVFVPGGNPVGDGFEDALGMRFTDFEYVTGSAFDDRLDLWNLKPGGVLSDAEQVQLDAARLTDITAPGSDPNAMAVELDARMELARLVPQNQQAVLIEGGDGHDAIRGTATGENRITGGEGNDRLFAGGFTSKIYGEGDDDFLQGGGYKAQLYGGEGTDTFGLANHTFVMDATTDESAKWGAFTLTGGVQQWWMESGWAYWTPFTAVLGSLPPVIGALFAAPAMLLDMAPMITFRYALTQSDQLIVQYARGYGGQAIINNYELDLDTGAATAGIVVFKQQFVNEGSLENFKQYLNLALKAGFGVGLPGRDPLVIDLDGDGLELTTQPDGVYFDIDNDGFAERTAWVKADDGLLVRDLDASGTIDDITELFGDEATSGFQHLADYDSDGNGVINALDADFGDLQIWRDLDGDGETDAGELQTLAEAGITEISLTTADPAVTTVEGNTVRAEASVDFADGSSSTISDVLLTSDQTDSRYLGDTTVSAAIAVHANLKGYGEVADLHVVMMGDADLVTAVTAFEGLAATTSWADLKADAADILMRWAGVDGVAATVMGGGSFDQQKLAFLEAYAGHELTPRDGQGVPEEDNLLELIDTWNEALESAALRLAAQGPLASAFSTVTFDVDSNGFGLDSAQSLADVYEAVLALLPADATAAQAEWDASWGPMLTVFAGDTSRADGFDIKNDFMVQSLARATTNAASSLTLDQLASGLGIDNATFGTAGADTIGRDGASGTQVYFGGEGDDTFTGGSGQDVFVFGQNFGDVTISDSEADISGDRIRFAFHTADQVTISRSGDDLRIEGPDVSDVITVVDHFRKPIVSLGGLRLSADHAIEEIQFADGTVFDSQDLSAAVGLGTSASETITGSGAADHIEGREGDDILIGGDNSDVYYYSRGDGNDIIRETMTDPILVSADTLAMLDGIALSDLRFLRDGASSDLRIEFSWAGDSITIEGQFSYGSLGYESKYAMDERIDAIFFGSGDAVSWVEVQDFIIQANTTSGDDTIHGFGTSDIFYASAGNDLMIGYDGGDTYRFGVGSGQDTIHDQSQYPETFVSGLIGFSWGSDDIVSFGAGITAADVTFSRLSSAGDLTIDIDGYDDTLTVVGQFDGVKLDLFNLLGIAWFNRVEKFVFEDGTEIGWQEVLARVTTGTDADENLYGAITNDRLDGKGGTDFLSGADGGDTYVFDRGYGNDTIEDNGNNVLITEDDTLLFGAGIAVDDVRFERTGPSNDAVVTIIDTGDMLTIKNQYGVSETGVFGAVAFDLIERFEWADGTVKTWPEIAQQIIDDSKTAGDDTIYGTHFDDVIDGGAGNDYLEGSDGSDTYLFGFGYGDDTIKDNRKNILSEADDAVVFGTGVTRADVTFSRIDGTNDLLISLSDGSTLTIEACFDVVYGIGSYEFNRVEEFRFEDDPALVVTLAEVMDEILDQASTGGDDDIVGFKRPETIEGGLGDDYLSGLEGADTYVYNIGDGHDVIRDAPGNILDEDGDVLLFGGGILPADVIVSHPADSPNDLVLTFSGFAGSVTLSGQVFYTTINYRPDEIESVEFADGTVWTPSDLMTRALLDMSTGGDETITGFFTDDRLDGGAGNDILAGGDGSDTYVFGVGYGNDTIRETLHYVTYDDFDVVEFAGTVTTSDITVSRGTGANDIVITLTQSGETLTIENQNGNSTLGPWWDIEEFRFTDGAVWTDQQAFDAILQAESTAGDDTIVGFRTDDAINGAAGNDTLSGGEGDDTLTGGTGNDTQHGGDGSDVYVFSAGDGQDVIEDNGWDDTDRLVIHGYDPDEVILSRPSFSTVVLSFTGSSDQITIVNELSGHRHDQIEEIAFDDGTVWTPDDLRTLLGGLFQTDGDDTIEGFSTNDVIVGGLGNDTLHGKDGSDTYVFNVGDGQDTIDDNGWDDTDQLVIHGYTPAEAQLSASGSDLTISFAGSADQITIINGLSGHRNDQVEQIVFDDGTVWVPSELRTMVIAGAATDGDDTISGFGSADTLAGGLGNDTLHGGDGSDVYVFNAGDGQDTIDDNGWDDTDQLVIHGYTPAETQISASGNNVVLTFSGSTDQVTIVNGMHGHRNDQVEQIVFDDGTIWDPQHLRDAVLAEAATDGDDTITAYGTHDTLAGGLGNDTLHGKDGSDTYVFNAGDGQDTIDDDGWDDTDQLVIHGYTPGEAELIRSGSDLTIAFAGSTDQVTIVNGLSGHRNDQIEQVVFDDATIWTAQELRDMIFAQAATDGDDTITGFGTYDTLEGGLGDDTLHGLDGSDTYVFNTGDGQDTVDDNGWGDTDQLIIHGYDPADVVLSRAAGDTLVINFTGSSDQVTVVSTLGGSSSDQIEQIVFDDGTIWTPADVTTLLGATPNWAPEPVGDLVSAVNTGAAFVVAAAALIANDTDADDNALTIVSVKNAVGGTVALDGNGDVVFTPTPGQTGAASFDYTVSDGTTQATATADISLSAASQQLFRVTGGSGDEFLPGTDADDLVRGGDGDDTLYGGLGDDMLLGEAGGNNQVNYDGYAGDYEFTYNADGSVTVTSATYGTDVLTDINGIWFNDEGEWYPIDDLYADSDGRRLLEGSAGDDTLNGSDFDDIIRGGDGNDTLYGDLGDDLLFGDGGSYNQVDYDGQASDYTFTLNTDGSVTVVHATYGTDILTDVGGVWFIGEGAWYSIDSLYAGNASGVDGFISGTSGDDFIAGTDSDDIIRGGDGDDTMYGGLGDDILLGEAGGNNQVNYDGTAADYTFTYNADGSVTVVSATYGSDTLADIAGIWFEGEQAWYAIEDLYVDADGIRLLSGTAGDDTLTGSDADDIIRGGDGDDTLYGGLGNDILLGEGGGYNQVDYDGHAGDYAFTLNADATVTVQSAQYGTDVLADIDGIWFVDEAAWYSIGSLAQDGGGDQLITGSDAADILVGTDGDDTMRGGLGNDRLEAGDGNDVLTGGAGDDLLVFASGFGNDTVTDFTAGAASDDVIAFKAVAGLASYADVQAKAADDGTDTTITLDADNSIVLANVLVSELAADDFLFW